MQPARQQAPLHVLIVDDCRDTAWTLASLVKLWGHEADVALDGPGALEAARKCRPDVAFLDLGMPGMDGWEVARRFRAQKDLGGVLLVAVSGYGRHKDLLHSHEAGFAHHLIKPVDPEVLKNLLAHPRRSTDMPPEEFARLLTDLTTAAEVVEAINDARVQARRGWDLRRWQYEPVPWGVRFRHYGGGPEPDAEVVVVSAAGARAEPVRSQLGELGPGKTFLVLE